MSFSTYERIRRTRHIIKIKIEYTLNDTNKEKKYLY